MSALKNVVVVAYGRSAIAKAGKKGALRQLHPVEMGGLVLKGILEQKLPQLDSSLIEDVIVGCAQQDMSQSFNLARLVASVAGLPHSVPGMSLNRFCSSGLQAVAIAAAQIEAGLNNVLVAGGVESMSAVPINIDHSKDLCPAILENDPDQYISMGLTAENVAARFDVTRMDMDTMAVESHRKAAAAQDAGKFDDEIIPLPGVDESGAPITFSKDQGIRRSSTIESVGQLDPCFKDDGRVTAATSSQVSDGAGFVVLMSADKARELGIKPLAKFISYAVAGCEPAYMGMGPIYAVPKAMHLAGLTMKDIDVVELNEAFAAQSIPCIQELGMNPAKVNPNGGAMALGHPLGATGAFLTCKALNELRRTDGRYALVTMCVGGGMGVAGIYEMS